MNRARKILALLLALTLCVSVLTACNTEPQVTTQGTTKATEGTTAGTTAATETTEAAPLKNVDIYPIDYDGTLKAVTVKTDTDKKVNWLR